MQENTLKPMLTELKSIKSVNDMPVECSRFLDIPLIWDEMQENKLHEIESTSL